MAGRFSSALLNVSAPSIWLIGASKQASPNVEGPSFPWPPSWSKLLQMEAVLSPVLLLGPLLLCARFHGQNPFGFFPESSTAPDNPDCIGCSWTRNVEAVGWLFVFWSAVGACITHKWTIHPFRAIGALNSKKWCSSVGIDGCDSAQSVVSKQQRSQYRD